MFDVGPYRCVEVDEMNRLQIRNNFKNLIGRPRVPVYRGDTIELKNKQKKTWLTVMWRR